MQPPTAQSAENYKKKLSLHVPTNKCSELYHRSPHKDHSYCGSRRCSISLLRLFLVLPLHSHCHRPPPADISSSFSSCSNTDFLVLAAAPFPSDPLRFSPSSRPTPSSSSSHSYTISRLLTPPPTTASSSSTTTNTTTTTRRCTRPPFTSLLTSYCSS